MVALRREDLVELFEEKVKTEDYKSQGELYIRILKHELKSH